MFVKLKKDFVSNQTFIEFDYFFKDKYIEITDELKLDLLKKYTMLEFSLENIQNKGYTIEQEDNSIKKEKQIKITKKSDTNKNEAIKDYLIEEKEED